MAVSIASGKKIKVSSRDLLQKFGCDFSLNEFVFTTKFVQSSLIEVKLGYVCRIENEADETPVFGLINKIIVNDEKFFFGYQLLKTIGFHKHFNAYIVVAEDLFFIRSANFHCKFSYIFNGVRNLKLVTWD